MAKLNSLEDLKKLFPEAEGTYQAPKEQHVQHLEAHFSKPTPHPSCFNLGRRLESLVCFSSFFTG